MNAPEIRKKAGDYSIISIIVAIATVLGSWGHDSINPPRHDPYTGTQAQALEKRILEKIEKTEKRVLLTIEKKAIEGKEKRLQMEARLREHAIFLIKQSEEDRPPDKARQRIKALERAQERRDPDWAPPTQDWH